MPPNGDMHAITLLQHAAWWRSPGYRWRNDNFACHPAYAAAPALFHHEM
jgi:hypothetical protein